MATLDESEDSTRIRPPLRRKRRGESRFSRSMVASVVLHAGLFITALALPMVSLRSPGKAIKEAHIEFDEPLPPPHEDLPEEEIEEVEAEELLPEPELMPVDLPDEDPTPELEPLRERPPDELFMPEMPMRFPEPPPPEVVVEVEPEVLPEEPQEVVVEVEPVRTEPVYDPTGNKKPRYPTMARRLGLEGAVKLLIRVAADGRVLGVTVVESSGHKVLDEAAVKAVETWVLEPGTVAGIPTEMEFEHEIVFTLQG